MATVDSGGYSLEKSKVILPVVLRDLKIMDIFSTCRSVSAVDEVLR
jgi:hypothetical protein